MSMAGSMPARAVGSPARVASTGARAALICHSCTAMTATQPATARAATRPRTMVVTPARGIWFSWLLGHGRLEPAALAGDSRQRGEDGRDGRRHGVDGAGDV